MGLDAVDLAEKSEAEGGSFAAHPISVAPSLTAAASVFRLGTTSVVSGERGSPLCNLRSGTTKVTTPTTGEASPTAGHRTRQIGGGFRNIAHVVTKDRRADRHRARREHVHRFDRCLVCGAPLVCTCQTGGRPAKYCSDAHRQEAYRSRQNA